MRRFLYMMFVLLAWIAIGAQDASAVAVSAADGEFCVLSAAREAAHDAEVFDTPALPTSAGRALWLYGFHTLLADHALAAVFGGGDALINQGNHPADGTLVPQCRILPQQGRKLFAFPCLPAGEPVLCVHPAAYSDLAV